MSSRIVQMPTILYFNPSTNPEQLDKPLPQLSQWASFKLRKSRFQARLKKKLPTLPKWMTFTGWRMTVLAGVGLSIFSFIANLVVLIWASTKEEDSQTGSAILYSGSYSSAQTILTWSRLAMNVLSTLLLGSSNAAMQCLTAPTREQVCKDGTEKSGERYGGQWSTSHHICYRIKKLVESR